MRKFRDRIKLYNFLFICSLISCSHAESICDLETVVTKSISGNPVLNWKNATENRLGENIAIVSARDEYEPASIAIHSKHGQCLSLQFSIDDLKLDLDPSHTIPKEHLQIKYVKKWFQGSNAWTGIKSSDTRKLVPELLVNDPLLVKIENNSQHNYLRINKSGEQVYTDISIYAQKSDRETPSIDQIDVRDEKTLQPIDIDQDPQQIWMTFHALEQDTPGKYKTLLHITQNNTEIIALPISVEILPFKLDDPFLEYSIFYRGQLTSKSGTISSEYKNETQYRAELKNMLAHGLSNPNIYQSFDNVDLLKKSLEIRKSIGFKNSSIYYLGKSASIASTPEKRKELSYYASTMKSICAPLGYTNIYFFGNDEAEGSVQHKQLASWQYARDIAGLKVFTTGYKGSFDNVGSQLDLFVLAGEPEQTEISKFHAAGKRVLTYAYPQSGPENPELFRRNFGLNLWALGSDGAMTYAYEESFGFTWNDFDHKDYRDHNFVYPTSDGVIDTIAWEGFREAVDDVRYLTTLNNLITKLRINCSTDNCRTEVSKAQSIATEAKTFSGDRDLDVTRKKIVTQILNLISLADYENPPKPPQINKVN